MSNLVFCALRNHRLRYPSIERGPGRYLASSSNKADRDRKNPPSRQRLRQRRREDEESWQKEDNHLQYLVDSSRRRRNSGAFQDVDRIKNSYRDAVSSSCNISKASSTLKQIQSMPRREGNAPPSRHSLKRFTLPKSDSIRASPFEFTKTTREGASSDASSPTTSRSILDTLAVDTKTSSGSSSPSSSSLFDVFRVKEQDSSDNIFGNDKSGAFDAMAFQRYLDLLHGIVVTDKPKFRRKLSADHADQVLTWLKSNVIAVNSELPSLRQALSEGLSPVQSSSFGTDHDKDNVLSSRRQDDLFRNELEIQRHQFCETMGWTRQQHELAQYALNLLIIECAKQAEGQPVQVIWEKVKEAGIVSKKLLHVLLYVSATFSSAVTNGRRHKSDTYGRLQGANSILDVLNNTSTPPAGNDGGIAGSSDEEETEIDQIDEIALFHDMLYEPTEQTINIRVRLLVAQNKAKEAEELLKAYVGEVELRLRTYVPVLLLFLDQGDLGSALRLFKSMQESHLVHLDSSTYINLLAGLADHGLFSHAAAPIDSATSLGYRAASGPELFNQLATEMALDVMEIPLASAKRLYNAFAVGFPNSDLEITSSMAPLKRTVDPAPDGSLVASRVVIDPLTGECPRSGVKLRLIHLTASERSKLKETIMSLARSGQVKFDQDPSRSPKAKSRRRSADEELLRFFQWLDGRNGEPFTAVVDAANVAYYLQNFEHGRFSFHQIKFVVEALESMGEHPLVVLPNKYTLPYFYVTIGAGSASGPRKQVQTEEELEIMRRLRDSGKVFVVPAGNLDDYFWILASVSEQTASRRGRDLQVTPGDDSRGRWPGMRPLLISNDQMRDHKLELLEPMLFRRWYSNYIVNYNFFGFVGDTCMSPEIGFSPADFYSREIQGNRGSDGSMVWHFPLVDSPDEWFCLRIPIKAPLS